MVVGEVGDKTDSDEREWQFRTRVIKESSKVVTHIAPISCNLLNGWLEIQYS